MTKTYTIHGLPDLPEGYGPDVHYGRPDYRDNKSRVLSPYGWVVPEYDSFASQRVYVLPTKPWYPAEWYDEHGQLLPDVYEHTPGEWPKHCKPNDVIEHLLKSEREKRDYNLQTQRAITLSSWDDDFIAAYRVFRKGEN